MQTTAGGGELPHRILTLDRQYASGGRAVGKAVADALGVPCYNREILEYAAERSGQTPEHLERLEETANTGLISSLQAAYARLARGERAALPPEGALLLAEAEVIRELADEGPCVLIGRSAGCILRDRTDVLRAFLYADEEARIRRAVDEYGHDENEAPTVLRYFDRRRANFYNANYSLKWEDKAGYHLCLDTGRLGVAACAKVLLRAMQD